MEDKKLNRRALLEKLVDMARGQSLLLSQNRFDDLAGTMAEREKIISLLKKAGKAEKSPETALIKEILDYDCNLRVSIEGELEDARRGLEKISNCNMAHRAYLSSQVKTPIERGSRDG